MTHREQLFECYSQSHSRYLDSENGKVAWFAGHLRENYLSLMPAPASRPSILEIGCSRGFMLTALSHLGFANLAGVDLSPADVKQAREGGLAADLHCTDALTFLRARPATFDVVIAKAILEHQEKLAVIPLLQAVLESLRPGGRVLIEVPNMDWVLAGHERYMDFTHEVGFTRESLAQVLRLVYGNAEVHPVNDVTPASGVAGVVRPLVRSTVSALVGLVLRALGNNAHQTLWNARSIIGVARRDDSVVGS